MRQQDEYLGEIAGWAESLTKIWPLPGGVIGLLDAEGRMEAVAFGRSDLERNITAHPNDMFMIGSISKTFLALITVHLAGLGFLNLDDCVDDHLSWLQPSLGAGVKIRHLLLHTGGLVKGADAFPDELAQIWEARRGTSGGKPGHFFHYSNLGYILLGCVLRAATGESLPVLYRRYLLEPLGMTRSLVGVTNADRSRLVQGYNPARDDWPWAPGDALSPAPWLEVNGADGNIATTVHELLRFAALLRDDGQFEGRSIVPTSVLQKMRGCRAPGGEDIALFGETVNESRYGLGVNVETVLGSPCLSHGGGMVGYSSFLLIDLGRRIALAVLTNAPGECPVAQVIARVAHLGLCNPERVEAAMKQSLLRANDDGIITTSHRLFLHASGSRRGRPAEITLTPNDDEIQVIGEGIKATLHRDWCGQFVTSHPLLRDFRFCRTKDGWEHGDAIYKAKKSDSAAKSEPHPAVGQYRSYSPWFPRFRIIERENSLFLSAPGGVEAPGGDMRLVQLSPGYFRIGDEAHLPERLTLGPVVEGKVITVNRDGCVYSRAFME